MVKTQYIDLAASFFNKIKDYNFITMPEDIVTSIVISYISKACIMFESCDQDLENRDDDLQQFNFSLTKYNFEILCNFMLIVYLETEYICTSQMLKSRLSSADFKSLQNPQQLSKVLELRNTLKSENDQLAINKSYKNSKLFDLVTNRKKV